MSDIHINTGSDFFGRIAIKDIHGRRYLISEGDEIRFFDNAKYTPANITVNGITYTALCSNVNT